MYVISGEYRLVEFEEYTRHTFQFVCFVIVVGVFVRARKTNMANMWPNQRVVACNFW